MTIETKYNIGDVIEWHGFNAEFHGKVEKISAQSDGSNVRVRYLCTLGHGKSMIVNEDSVWLWQGEQGK